MAKYLFMCEDIAVLFPVNLKTGGLPTASQSLTSASTTVNFRSNVHGTFPVKT
jgi:hypothetical protein